MSPEHRRSWRSLWRRCSCGLKEPCIDRLTASVRYLPTAQPPPPPVPPRHPEGAVVEADIRASAPHSGADPNDGYAAVYLLDRAARAPGSNSGWMRRTAWARVPVAQPGRAGSLTPAQAQRADHAERRQDVPRLRAAAPGRSYGSGPPRPPRNQVPARNRPGPARDWTHDGRQVGDSTS